MVTSVSPSMMASPSKKPEQKNQNRTNAILVDRIWGFGFENRYSGCWDGSPGCRDHSVLDWSVDDGCGILFM